VLGRFPLANAIYNDYNLLEKRAATNAIEELLSSRVSKKVKHPNTELYAINSLDFAQEDAIGKLNQNGNMVVYGPPGTGKSQTIVNIITDALCKNKRVLVVSQKKAALDVVNNRLGALNERTMYIVDPEKNKADFYARTKAAHLSVVDTPESVSTNDQKFQNVKIAIQNEVNVLEDISNILFTPTAFGISLQEMYAKNASFGNTGVEKTVYGELLKNPKLMKLNYNELDNAVRVINEKRKSELYYKRLQAATENPLIIHIKNDLDVHTISTARNFVSKLLSKRLVPFDMSKYPNARQLLAFYLENGLSQNSELKPIIRFIAKVEKKKTADVTENFAMAMEGFKTYVDKYALFETILDKKGFAMTLEGMLSGNTIFLKMLQEALDNYVAFRDMNLNMRDLTEHETMLLNFAYENSGTLKEFKDVISKIIPARIYRELVDAEARHKKTLARIMDYENIKNRIVSLKGDQREIVKNICLEVFKSNYSRLYNSTPENKNFLYQITKGQNLWPLRKLMEVYGELMLTLFPCWLLSPEDVSTIMPLKENLFDLILFDEASQIFIESTLPTIYRGRHIVVAGDNKQLRPSAQFIRRYMGTDIDDADLSTQAALEVESLLDLATSRYSSVNLNYHYRSRHEEFISFSNYAFYNCKLEIAPNLTKNTRTRPIERVKVDGNWIDRKNRVEAMAVVKLIKKILTTRKSKETIGVVTFNAEQEQYIKDLLDDESQKDITFRNKLLKEQNRKENGEDVSLFVKNLENVQGDERDIIIFSIGYAKNEQGRVFSNFGPLNTEGGENRLNVAITRAREKIYVVTSIEPEELNVDGTKNQGPKIFKKYLQYVRAVSNNNPKEAKYILEGFNDTNKARPTQATEIVRDMKDALEKLGYTVETNIGDNRYKLSLAVYDKKLDQYLVGVELDNAAFNSSNSVIERDVFRSVFMASRGWKILRVWSRDFWLSRTKVINQIDRMAIKAREALEKK
jgi:superfamily I DNA and/or RNA helicase/very-short-patch-repair endonuclease